MHSIGRVSHSLGSNVDWLPTAASLAGVTIPANHQEGLRGIDISSTFKSVGGSSSSDGNTYDDTIVEQQKREGEQDKHYAQHQPAARPPLFWRGGGGSPPCYDRSPSLAMRHGDWKLLFSPRLLGDAPNSPENYRVELYNLSIAALGEDGMNNNIDESGGAFFETVNEAKYRPDVVNRMMNTMMAWHNNTPCPFGNHNNSRQKACKWVEYTYPGCKAYPFPGMAVKSCRGQPCPHTGTPGPCVCPPIGEGTVGDSSEVDERLEALYADHLLLLNE